MCALGGSGCSDRAKDCGLTSYNVAWHGSGELGNAPEANLSVSNSLSATCYWRRAPPQACIPWGPRLCGHGRVLHPAIRSGGRERGGKSGVFQLWRGFRVMSVQGLCWCDAGRLRLQRITEVSGTLLSATPCGCIFAHGSASPQRSWPRQVTGATWHKASDIHSRGLSGHPRLSLSFVCAWLLGESMRRPMFLTIVRLMCRLVPIVSA